MLHFAQRLQALQTNVFADIDRAKGAARTAGLDLIDLSLGSSDLAPPPQAIATIHAALDDPSTYGYALFESTQFFREACAQWYERTFGLPIDPETEVLPLIGSQEGTAHLPLALLNPGEIALLCDPGYPSHAGGVYLAGGQIHLMPLLPEAKFRPDLAAIPPDICAQARMMVLSYPNNPTAGVATPEFWQEAVDFCRQHDIALVHDFPYVDWVFGAGPAPSALQATGAKDNTIEFFSFSKSFHMGGFRVGYAIGNRDLIMALRQVKAVVDFNQYRGILRAAAQMLTEAPTFVQAAKQEYQHRRDCCVQALAEIGWVVPLPPAAMYLWAPLPPGYDSSVQFCLDLVKGTGVALAPGVGFGPRGEGYVRFALVEPVPRLEEAVARLQTFLANHP